MMNVACDVNFFLDACRFRDTLADAAERQNDRMRVLQVLLALGPRSGLRLHMGQHVRRNIALALRREDVSRRSVTRDAWSSEDIDSFLSFVEKVVEATGGNTRVETVSHDAGIGRAKVSGAPDGEDQQMLSLAVRAGATVLATNDKDLLAMGSYHDVEIWKSSEIDAEVSAVVRRMQRDAQATAA